ncbi:MAG TPA: hypothetical protein PK691_12180 [Thermomicrobiales bacterium]|nr:hypothetical protein [Thermomicrobiales bacterium]
MRRRRIQSFISGLLLLTSAVLLAVVAFLYFGDDHSKAPDESPRATAVPGHYQMIDVLELITDTGLKAELGGSKTGVRSRMLSAPGQLITVGKGSVYVFIYPDIASQDEATLDVDAADVDITTLDGTRVSTDDATLSANSNIAVLILGLDDSATTKIDKAIQSLP